MLFYLEESPLTFSRLFGSDYSDETMSDRFRSANRIFYFPRDAVAYDGEARYDKSEVVLGEKEETYRGKDPRWVSVVFANYDSSCNDACGLVSGCNLEYAKRCFGGVAVDYDFEFRNGPSEFSWDEYGILWAFVALAAVYGVYAVACCALALMLSHRVKFHRTAQLLVASVLLSFGSQVLKLAHYAVARDTGSSGVRWALSAGHYAAALSDTAMAALLVLFAQGYTVCRRKLKARTRVHLAVFGVTYATAEVCIWVWFEHGGSGGGGAAGARAREGVARRTVYESAPGYVFVVLRCATTVWVVRAAVVMRSHYRTKAGFYYVFCIVAAAWAATPAVVAAATALAAEEDRQRVAMVMEPVFLAVVHAVLLAVLNPNKALNPIFPYHSKTKAPHDKAALRWRAQRRPGGGQNEARPSDALVNPGPSSHVAISGGRALSIDAHGKYVVEDGFEALHITRLKHIQAALEVRVGALTRLAMHLESATKFVDLDEDADDGSDDDDPTKEEEEKEKEDDDHLMGAESPVARRTTTGTSSSHFRTPQSPVAPRRATVPAGDEEMTTTPKKHRAPPRETELRPLARRSSSSSSFSSPPPAATVHEDADTGKSESRGGRRRAPSMDNKQPGADLSCYMPLSTHHSPQPLSPAPRTSHLLGSDASTNPSENGAFEREEEQQEEEDDDDAPRPQYSSRRLSSRPIDRQPLQNPL